MSGIRDRAGLRSLVDANITDGSASITPADHREVENSLTDSLVLYGEQIVRVVNMTTTTPPGSPADRDAYVVAATATGTWVGWENDIAVWDGQLTTPAWVRVPRFDGMLVLNLADDLIYRWDSSGAAWVQLVSQGATPYDVPVVKGDTPTASEVIGRFTLARAIDFPADFAGSVGSVETNPTASFAIDVQDDGTSIGTITISTAGAYTFATSGGTAKTVAAGSKLEFIAPASTDATIAGISLMLLGTTG